MEESAKAYREIYEILKYIPQEQVEKLPDEFTDFIEKHMARTYNYEIKNIQEFDKQEMLEETRIILAILYRDYWAEPEKKQEIVERDNKQIKEQEEKQEAEKKQQAEMEAVQKATIEQQNIENKQLTDLVPYKESFITKMLNRIKKWFRFWRY